MARSLCYCPTCDYLATLMPNGACPSCSTSASRCSCGYDGTSLSHPPRCSRIPYSLRRPVLRRTAPSSPRCGLGTRQGTPPSLRQTWPSASGWPSGRRTQRRLTGSSGSPDSCATSGTSKRGAQTYGERTIAEALARQTEHYTPHNGARLLMRVRCNMPSKGRMVLSARQRPGAVPEAHHPTGHRVVAVD